MNKKRPQHCSFFIGKHEVIVDAEDVARVWEKSWRITQNSQGHSRVVTSIRTMGGVRTLTLAHFIMRPHADQIAFQITYDPILDYRKCNLVACTRAEMHQRFRKRRADASSQFRGVSFLNGVKKWRAGIEVDGKTINLGDFPDESSAARAWNAAARIHFGDHAYQNLVGSQKARKVS